jgi:D-aminopeptidase
MHKTRKTSIAYHPPARPFIGILAAGASDSITDVPGVQVGHCTLDAGPVQTGVTVILPHAGNLFRNKVPAAVAVLNGFGKSVGLLQLQELGVLETPIALTNTFAVGALATAQIRAALADDPEIGRALPTLNPLVFECNDGYLNDLHAFSITESHYLQALKNADAQCLQGAVGAGRGMSCFELKGGIGSASRLATIADRTYTVGTLVLANFGKLQDLILAGMPLGRDLVARRRRLPKQEEEQQLAQGQAQACAQTHVPDAPHAPDAADAPEKGSIIMIVATDAPLDARQLHRLAVRAGAGLARTGSVYGHGSGDLALAFSTAWTVSQTRPSTLPPLSSSALNPPNFLHDSLLDPLFRAVADSVEQAIVNALFAATTVTGRDGHTRRALSDAEICS